MYSVIIPSIGRIEYLNELLKSIFRQTILPKEIFILLDDNKLCKKIERKIFKRENCKVIFCKNLNLAEKRNYGALNANTNFLIFSDDDDIWELNKAKFTIECLKDFPVVCHEFSKFGQITRGSKFRLGKKKKILNLKSLLFGTNIFGGGSGIAARKEIVMTLKFNKNLPFCEDYEWWVRVLLADIKIQYVPISLVRYRVHQKNMTSNFLKIYYFNFKIFNYLFIKACIMILICFIGYLRILLGTMIKTLKNLIFKMRQINSKE